MQGPSSGQSLFFLSSTKEINDSDLVGRTSKTPSIRLNVLEHICQKELKWGDAHAIMGHLPAVFYPALLGGGGGGGGGKIPPKKTCISPLKAILMASCVVLNLQHERSHKL